MSIIDLNQKLGTDSIDALAAALLNAKHHEQNAREARIAIEERLIEVVGSKPDSSFTYKTPHYKVVTTGKIARKLDRVKYLEMVNGKIPESLDPVITKLEINPSKLKYIQNHEPDMYRLMTLCMESKQNKTAVKVEAIDE